MKTYIEDDLERVLRKQNELMREDWRLRNIRRYQEKKRMLKFLREDPYGTDNLSQ